ncbi:MAG TPA: acyl-CoA dehydrogenase [Afifellaceae bacterium]|nr:acyl-CoA dehydrogenase [Afifellaceae bacterium]
MYRAPVSEIAFTLKHVAGMSAALEENRFGELSEDLVDAILEEAGKFASEEIAPLDAVADKHGTPLKDGAVTTPPGWRDAYHRWCEAGWNGLTGPEAYGGQDLPTMLSIATQEMWNAASMSYAVGPMLTIGAIEAISAHASQDLKDTYLPKMVTGEWTGTMNLTEPQAGSDLGALKCRAEPTGDGRYRIFGQKIFITYGEHDMTDNIVHLVLARLPDAPPGTKGISLFLVPKFLVNDDGSVGERNDVFCNGVEHKLGIHGSPTCSMIYGDGYGGREPGAIGWLVGEENRGLACMFTMMNNARLAVGVQGVGIAERALQKATAYAAERRQGSAPGWTGEGMSPIVEHPDIKQMLLHMRGLTSASRAICYACAHAIDMAETSETDKAKHWQERANLLTPVAKAFSTDSGTEVASLGVQIHGGMGYIEETGAARHLRNARIAQIYEGTNGIQAIDLVTRKLPQSGGRHVLDYIEELRAIAEEVRQSNRIDFGRTGERLAAALDDLEAATTHLQTLLSEGRIEQVLAGATPYLRLFGLAAGGCYLARGALASGGDSPASSLRALTARAFAERNCPDTAGLRATVADGASAVTAADADLLAG